MPASRLKQKVLFLCTGNSCRSQMAEGLLRAMAGDMYEVHSAGVIATGVNPVAAEVMREAGIDISEQWSKSVDEYAGRKFDYVITLCDNARQTCPVFPGSRRVHWSIEDPVQFFGPDDERLVKFREARDLIKERIREYFEL